MNTPLLAAAALTAAGTLLHAVAGELFLFRPLHGSPLPVTTMPGLLKFVMPLTPLHNDLQWRYFRGGWHLFTADAALASALLFASAFGAIADAPLVARISALHFAFYMVVWLGIVVVQTKQNIVRAPQWFLMGLVGALALWGSQV